MQIYAKRGLIPPGTPRINWSNQLSNGLTGAYLPSAHSNLGKIYDLTGLGATLVVQSAARYIPTREGMALRSTAASTGAFATASTAQQPTTQGSIFWRGYHTANASANTIIAGVSFANTDTTPFDGLELFTASGGFVQATSNVAGVQVAAGNGTVVINVLQDWGLSATTGGSLLLYGNGIQVATNAMSAGSITYSTPQMQIGTYMPQPTRLTNVVSFVTYTWNRALTALEQSSLHYDPYQLLIFPDDDIMATLDGVGILFAQACL